MLDETTKRHANTYACLCLLARMMDEVGERKVFDDIKSVTSNKDVVHNSVELNKNDKHINAVYDGFLNVMRNIDKHTGGLKNGNRF